MKIHIFTTKDNKQFWIGSQPVYQAAENAAPLVFLTKAFVGEESA